MHSFSAQRSAVYAPRAMVATSQPLATLAGLEVLKYKGNAVDAAIAIAATLNVLEPMMGGIGGDACALVYWHKDKTVEGLNATGRVPRLLSLKPFSTPPTGMESITIPGAFDGWCQLHEKYGNLPFASLFAAAIYYAEQGFAVSEKTSQFWEDGVSKLRDDPDSQEAFLIQGRRAPKPGEIFRQPDLAHTLRFLAKGGREAFYEGNIGKQLVNYAKMHGEGCLEIEDFYAQRSEWMSTVSAEYRDCAVHQMALMEQKPVILEVLRGLEKQDLRNVHTDLIAYEHALIRALKMTIPETGISKEGGIYFTVVDEDKNAVSFAMSLRDVFGSGIVPKGTGIVLNNGRGFSCLHSMSTPSLVFKQEELWLSCGCIGNSMQVQGQVQLLSNLIDRSMGLQHSLAASRVRVTAKDGVMLEETFAPSVIEGLGKRGEYHVIKGLGFMGGAQAIMRDVQHRTLVGASDPRLDGLALGY